MKTTIGQRIRQARIKAGMTQAQLAEAISCRRANVCMLESGSGGTNLSRIPSLCRALGVSADYLFGLTGE